MNPNIMECDEHKLKLLLAADEQAVEHDPWMQHVEHCSHCQSRLRELAAQADDWQKAAEILAADDDDVPYFGRDHDAPSSWNESMVKQLLEPPSHPEMLGRLGRYEMERMIGCGGMGIVFKAFDTELNRVVAVKLLAPYLAARGSARKRFAREARAAAGVRDDHVVPIFNVESEHEPPFLVMQYVAGGSLQEKLDRDGPLEVAEVLRIGLQTAKGLAAAHAQGLIHRDVKPSNVLLDEGVERALLTDFGLARAEDDACLTRSGFHPGTPHYMSPEQVRGEAIDGRSDLFSLGCVLYALCTGHSPFRAETSYAVMRRITDESPRSIREQNANIPEWLEAIVMKLLNKSREDRFASAKEVAELLEDCLAHVHQPATTPLPVGIQALAAQSVSASTESLQANRLKARHQRIPPIAKFIAAAAGACALIFAGVLIVLELGKGTLTIESEMDNVPIRIMQGDKVVEKMTVSKSGNSVRVAAGTYVVELDAKLDGMVVENDQVSLKRGDSEQISIRYAKPLANSSEGSTPDKFSKSLQGEWEYVSVETDGVITAYKTLEVQWRMAVYPTISEAIHNRLSMRLGSLSHLVSPALLVQRLKVAGDRWTVQIGDGTTVLGSGSHRVEIDGNKLTFHGMTPMMPGLGSNSNDEIPTIGYGLWQVDGDTLTYLMTPAVAEGALNGQGQPPIEFPDSFETKGTKNTVYRLRRIASEAERRVVPDEIEVTREELLEYYEAHLEDWKVDGRAKWRQLTARFDRYPTKQEARAAIESMGNEIYLGGAPFEAVAKARSQGFSSKDGGMFDWTTQGALKSKPLDQAIFSIPLKRLSLVIEDEIGYHIIEVLEREEARTTSFSEAYDDMRAAIVKTKRDKISEEYRKKVIQASTPPTPSSSTNQTQSKSSPEYPSVKIVVHDEEGKPLEGVKVSLIQLAKDQGGQVLEINETSNASGLAVNRNLPYGHYELSATTADGWYLTGYRSRLNVEFEKGVDAILVAPTPGKTSKLVISSGVTTSPEKISGLRFGGLTEGNRTDHAPEPEGSDSFKEKEFSSFPTITNGIEYVGAEIGLQVTRNISQPAPSMQQMNTSWTWSRPPNSKVSFRYLIANGQARGFDQFDEKGYTARDGSLKLPPVDGSEFFKLNGSNYQVGATLLKLREPIPLPLELDIPAGDVTVKIGSFFGKPSASVMAALKWQPRGQQPELWLQAYLAPDSAWVERLINIDWINSPFRSGGSVGFTALWRDQALQPGERLEIPLGMKQVVDLQPEFPLIAWDFEYPLLGRRMAKLRVSKDLDLESVFPGRQTVKGKAPEAEVKELIELIAQSASVDDGLRYQNTVSRIAEFDQLDTSVRNERVAVNRAGRILELQLNKSLQLDIENRLWRLEGIVAIGGQDALTDLIAIANQQLQTQFPEIKHKLTPRDFLFGIMEDSGTRIVKIRIPVNKSESTNTTEMNFTLTVPTSGEPKFEQVAVTNSADDPPMETPALPKTPDKSTREVDSPKIYTAKELIANGMELYKNQQIVTVRFKVASVRRSGVIDPDGKETQLWFLSSEEYKGGSDPEAFEVEVSMDAEKALERSGVKEIPAHFNGQELIIVGKVSIGGLELLGRDAWVFGITLERLDQLHFVKGDGNSSLPQKAISESAAGLADNIATESKAPALDHRNARSVVEAYVAAALAGDVEKAASLAKNSPADPKRIRELPEFLNIQRLKIETVYVNDPAKPTQALATSVEVKLDEEHKNPDGRRDGYMVFTLKPTDDKWFVTDIAFETKSGEVK